MPIPALRLTIDLVPKTALNNNVRSEVPPQTWIKLSEYVIQRAGSHCEICGGGATAVQPLRCHEVYEYTAGGDQRLILLQAICTECDEVKHINTEDDQDRADDALKHLARVNSWNFTSARAYYKQSLALFEERSRRTWKLDIALVDEVLRQVPAHTEQHRDGTHV